MTTSHSSHTTHAFPALTGQPRRRREHALAALLLSGFILVFLAEPLRSYRTSLYTPADLTQISSLTRVDPEHRVGNPILGDVVLQMHSWLLFGRDELRSGRMPLINPYNGGGTPHFANYQSAVLSPFSVPFYVLSLKNALLVAAFLKLFCLGFFTYLFLREIGLVFLAGMTGAVAFMFAGYNVLLLGYPHPAAMITLPLGLFFAERIFRRFERGPGEERTRSANAGHAATESPALEPDASRSDDAQSARSRTKTARPNGGAGLDSFRGNFSPFGAALRAPMLVDVGALPFLGFGAALVLGLFAGQPEPLYFSVLVIAAYIAMRLVSIWMGSRRDRRSLESIVRLTGTFVFVAALAVGIAAVQLLPFFEYLGQSRLLEQRSHVQTPLSLVIWPLFFFPNLLGNPSTHYQISESLPPPDFETANLVYSGGIVLLLSLISLFFVNRNRVHAFLVFVALAWFVYAYDVGGAWRAFALIPSVDLAPINRSQGVWEFALACCASFTVHHFVHVRVPVRSMLFASTLFAGVLVLATFFFGAQHLAVYAYAYYKQLPGREAIYQYSTPHLIHVSLAFIPGILALSVMLLAPQGRLRRILTFAILVSVFLQTGHLFRHYNTISEERFVFPKTQAVSDLAETVGRDYLAVIGDDTVIPDSNILYRIATPASYDGMWIDRYDRLYREVFGEGNNWRPMSRGSLTGLELFGVDYVLSEGDWLEIDTPFVNVLDNPRAFYETQEIVPGADVVQTFTGTHDRLQAIRLFAGSLGHAGAGTLHVTLEDPRDGSTIAEQDFNCRMLSADPARRTSLVFTFAPIADSRGRIFRLRVSSPDARPGDGVSLWCRSDWKHWINLALWRSVLPHTLVATAPRKDQHEDLARWRLFQGKESLGGGLYFNLSGSRDALRGVRAIGEQTLYEIVDGPSRFHMVRSAVSVDDDEQAFARVQSHEFDPKREVVLVRGANETTPAAGVDRPSPVRIVEEEPTHIRLEIEHSHPGWLVIAKPWFPGWNARVDGEARDLVRANYAFSALRIGTGESKVELEYDPSSFRRGLWISILSTASLALFLGLVALRTHRHGLAT